VEDRREDVVVREVPAAVVRVVRDEHVAVERPSGPKNSTAKRTGSVDDSMNCGMPTESAASCPVASRIVAFRSFDWFRIGVVAVRLTCVAIS
jgi:hypothetical protein